MYFDSHAHLSSPLIQELPALLERAEKAKISKMINVCTDLDTLEKGVALHAQHPHIYNAAATTPHDVEKEGELFFPIVEKKAEHKELVAIGETGLDYYYEHSPKALQKEYLVRYLHLAQRTNLPIIIHCRDAFSDLFDIVDQEYRDAPLLLHCFTGSEEEAKKALDRNWWISLSGIITFPKSAQLREVVKKIPLERLLAETDAPYLAPHSRRGKPNEPSFLPETLATIATLKGISLEEAASATFQNASTFFRIH